MAVNEATLEARIDRVLTSVFQKMLGKDRCFRADGWVDFGGFLNSKFICEGSGFQKAVTFGS